MQIIRTNELKDHVGERVALQGWLHQTRAMGGINFLILRDAQGMVQAVTEDAESVAPLQGVLPESVIRLEGVVVAEAQARSGYELHDLRVEVVTPVTEALPFPLNKPVLKVSQDIFLDHATVGLRHPTRRALFRISASIMGAFRGYLNSQGFVEIQSPKLVAAATESGANVFPVSYFDKKAFLAQSPQFYKQIMVGVFERVYEVAPVFRAEPSDTTRHLAEYVSLDAEFGFIENHFTVMAMLTEVVRAIIAGMQERSAEVELLKIELPEVPATIPHIHFSDAQQLIFERYKEDCRGEPDLAPQHERWLGEWARETHNSDFLFVTGYPMVKRPFYTHADPERPEYSNSFDLLFRGTELVTGGQRLHRYEDYLAVLERAGLPLEPFEGYLEPMKYGMPPHGGFAIGLERFVMQMARLTNIREATLFPRDLHRLTP
jgi:nondiscriminating aspartyl-tRNA synthetase